MALKSLTALDVKYKTVLLRIDLNVPMLNGEIKDMTRIERSLPTINYLVNSSAKVVIISHRGRPQGKIDKALSLEDLVPALSKALNREVFFCSASVGEKTKKAIAKLNSKEILLLENLRFYSGEENNSDEFSTQLAELGDVYVNDTFSCSHRKHASIWGIAKKLPAAAGFLLLDELKNIIKLVDFKKKPFTTIIGGSKISTKLNLLKHLCIKADYLIIGGAMANTFLASLGFNIGNSLYEPNLLSEARAILSLGEKVGCKVVLPSDLVSLSSSNKVRTCSIKDIENEDRIMDIGPETISNIREVIEKSATIVWNGPLGIFEQPPFNKGCEVIAKAIADQTDQGKLCSIAGGGDTMFAIKATNLADKFSYISTGGGAFLEWLEGKLLPGIEVLQSKKR